MKDENLGKHARCVITNFEGIATAKCEYIDGATQYLITPIADEKGNMRDEKWIDKYRLYFGEIIIFI